MKRWMAVLCAAVLLNNIGSLPVHAEGVMSDVGPEISPGDYLANITAVAVNPENGKADAVGADLTKAEQVADAILTPEDREHSPEDVFEQPVPEKARTTECLVERTEDGHYFATLRFFQANRIVTEGKEAPVIEVRQKDGGYRQATTQVTKRKTTDGGMSYEDIRFEIPMSSSAARIKVVLKEEKKPVIFYAVINSMVVRKGHADFVVMKRSLSSRMTDYIAEGLAALLVVGAAFWIIRRNKRKDAGMSGFPEGAGNRRGKKRK